MYYERMEDILDIDKIDGIIQLLREYVIKDKELNIFSLGGRGHYENPISDLLYFFMNPHEQHGLSDLVLHSFIESLPSNLKNKIESDEFISIGREHYTENGKRIDLIIEGREYIIVIENKIYAGLNNPLDEYEETANKMYNDKRIKLFCLLTPESNQTAGNWKNIQYSHFIANLKKNMASRWFNIPAGKWPILLREFILNLEEITGGGNIMKKEFFNKIDENIDDLLKIDTLINEYVKELIARHNNMEDGLIQKYSSLTFDITFITKADGVLIGYNSEIKRERNPSNYTPIIYIGKDGKLRSQLWTNKVEPMLSKEKVNDGLLHRAVLVISKKEQELYLDGKCIGQIKKTYTHLDQIKNFIGLSYCSGWPCANDFWFPFRGEIIRARIFNRALKSNEVIQLDKPAVFQSDLVYDYAPKKK